MANKCIKLLKSGLKSLRKAWSGSLPLKLRLLQGNPKIISGLVLHFLAGVCFATLFWIGMESITETTYMSLEYTESKITRTKSLECSMVDVVQTADVQIDENGEWSSSSNFESQKTIKELSFQSYSGNSTVFDSEMAELNECIREANEYSSSHLLPETLLGLSFYTCETSSRMGSLTFSIHWPFLYDFSISEVISTYTDNTSNSTAYLESNNSSFEAEISQSSTLLKLSITCAAGTTEYPKDFCGYVHHYTYYIEGNVSDPFPEVSFSMTLDLETIARCVAVNIGVYDVSYTDDLLILSNETDYYSALYTSSVQPMTMYMMKDLNICYLLYVEGYKSALLYPTQDFIDTSCNLACGDPMRNCSSETNLKINLEVLSPFTYESFGQLQLKAYGSQGVLNEYYYYFGKSSNLSCNPILNPIPNYTEIGAPFTLVEDFYKCTQIVSPSWSVVLASSYANTQIALAAILTVILLYVAKCCKGESNMIFDDEEVEIASLELAVHRIQEKKEMGVPLDEFVFKHDQLEVRGLPHSKAETPSSSKPAAKY